MSHYHGKLTSKDQEYDTAWQGDREAMISLDSVESDGFIQATMADEVVSISDAARKDKIR